MSMHFYTKTQIAKAGKRSGPRGPRRQTTKTYQRLSALSKTMGSALKVDLVGGITTFKDKISSEELAKAWAKGDYGHLFALIPWRELPADLAPALSKIETTVARAADFQLEKLPANINENLRFDVSNPGLRSYIQTRTGALVQGIQADAQLVLQDAITRSFTEALTPDEVADQIRGSIGLFPAQERALARYREGLVAQGVDPERIEVFADAYEERLLDWRCANIARTETRGAVNQGQLSIWKEGVNQGLIDRASAKKEWVVDGDPCDVCDPQDGVAVGLDEPWILSYRDGSVKYVQVPSEAHPSCLCGMELHFAEGETESEEEL